MIYKNAKIIHYNNNKKKKKKKRKKKKKKERVFSPLPHPLVDVIPLSTGDICIIGTVFEVFDEAFIWSN